MTQQQTITNVISKCTINYAKSHEPKTQKTFRNKMVNVYLCILA
jgi:hypothetical protein